MTKIVKRTTFPAIFNDLDRMKTEFITPFDALFNKVFNDTFPTATKELGPKFFEQGSYPKVNVEDHPDKVVIEAAVPGLTKSDVDIEILKDTLTLSGGKQMASEQDGVTYTRRELKKSAFQRSFTLGDNLVKDDISAKFSNGLLRISLPKVEPQRVEEEVPKKVKIK